MYIMKCLINMEHFSILCYTKIQALMKIFKFLKQIWQNVFMITVNISCVLYMCALFS